MAKAIAMIIMNNIRKANTVI